MSPNAPRRATIVFTLTLVMIFSTSVVAVTVSENRTAESGEWVKQGMVMDTGGFALGVEYPFVLYHEGVYKMWYSGHYATLSAEIYYATSTDGLSWTPHGRVLACPSGIDYVVVPSVMVEPDGTYKMWFSAHDGPWRSRTYLATSEDGINWVNRGLVLPLGPAGSADSVYTVHAHVYKDAGTYHMYYKGYDENTKSSIMYATSNDGYAWTKHGVVIGQPAGFTNIGCPHVVKYGETEYTMWYYGSEGVTRIYESHSTDGLTWTTGEVAVDVGAPGEQDDYAVHGPYVMTDPVSGEEVMYYSGSDGSQCRIFLALHDVEATVDLSVYEGGMGFSDEYPMEGDLVTLSAIINGDTGTSQSGTDWVTVFEDDFDSESAGTNPPANWNYDIKYVYKTVEVDSARSVSNPNAMHLESQAGKSGRGYADCFGPINSTTDISFKLFITDDSSYYGVHVQGPPGNFDVTEILTQVGFDDKNGFVSGVPHAVLYLVEDREPIPLYGVTSGTWTPNVWFEITLRFDFNDYTFDLWKDGVLILEDSIFYNPCPFMSTLGYYVLMGSNNMWVDDILVQSLEETTQWTAHDATCTVSFYLDSVAEENLIDRQYNVFVPGGGQTTVTADWTAQTPGDHDIFVEVSESVPEDGNPANNLAGKTIHVQASTTVDLSIYDGDITLSDANPYTGDTVDINAVVHGDQTIWGSQAQETLIFEDDFDAGNFNKWVTSYWNPQGLLEISGAHSNSPPYSMHAQSYPNINTGPWVFKSLGTEYENIKGETWFYLPVKSQEYEFFDIIRMASTVPGWNGGIIYSDYVMKVLLDDDDYSVDVVEVTWDQSGNHQKHVRAADAFELTPLVWHQVILDIAGSEFTVTIDGNVIFQGDRYDTVPIDYIFLGDPGGQSGGGGDGYWDDVSVWAFTETPELIHQGLDATCNVSFYLDSIDPANLIGHQTDVFVPADGQTTVGTSWIAEYPGAHDIIVDVTDVNPPDSDLSNNVASIPVNVQYQGTETATATGPQGAHHDPVIEITYEWTESPTAVLLYYSTNSGDSWNYLGTDYSVDGSYYWVPGSHPGPKPAKFYWIANAQNGADDVGIPANGTPPEAGPFNWKCWDVCEDAPLPLNQGASNWFFVSVPLEITGDLVSVFDDAEYGDGGTTWDYIQWYDASDPADPWKSYSIYRPDSLNDQVVVDNTMGFWIHLTSNEGDGVLTAGSGTQPVSTAIQLHAGWNLVGYPTSCETRTVTEAFWGTGVDRVEVFDLSSPYRLQAVGPNYVMQPGEGYWVHVASDTVWVVDW